MAADQAKRPVEKAPKLPPRGPPLRVKPTFMQKSKYRHLLDDPNVYRWFRNILRRSPVSAGEHIRRLGWLCEHFATNPQELAGKSKREARDWTEDMISLLEDEGKRSSYISNLFKTAKSWFKHNGKRIEVEYRVVKGETGLYAEEKPPTNDELRRIFDAADIRQKVAVSLMAFSGFRDETLGDLTGIDGLKIRDFPEMTISNGTVQFNAIPTFVICRATVSKDGYEYRSLLSEEGCEYLKTYLTWRMQAKEKDTKQIVEGKMKTVRVKVPGEELTPDSPILTPIQLNVGTHIHTTNISGIIKQAIVKAGFNWRPYALRRYFAKRLLRAEDDRLIPGQYAKFWMGHMGEVQLKYTLAKGLDEEDLERLRKAYQRLDEAHLTTLGRKPPTQERLVSDMRDTMLGMLGATEEERQKLNLAKLTEDEFRDLLRQKAAILFGLNGRSRQKIIAMGQVAEAITQGWEFVIQLSNDQAVVRSPA